MKVTFLGTTVLLFDDGKDQVLFDAHLTRPNMLTMAGLLKVQTNKAIVDKVIFQFGINRLKAIFISHTHTDHVLDAAYISNTCNADIYGSYSAMNVGRGGNVPEEKLHSYDDCRDYSIGDYEITVIPSIHSKAHWYNDDLGQVIDKPIVQPAKKKEYKEGGSYDFLVKNGGKTYLIRPSFNYIEGQLDGIKADVLYLGIAGISRADEETKKKFFEETVEKVKPQIVLPIHWDNFFKPLYSAGYNAPFFMDNTDKTLYELVKNCGERGVASSLQLPLTTLEF